MIHLYIQKEINEINQDEIELLELKLLHYLYNNNTESKWLKIKLNENITQDIHIIETKNFSCIENKTIILIHGYGATSALSWRNTINYLYENKNYNILSIDLPGFGRSDINNQLLNSMNYNELTEFYCNIFENIFQLKNIHHSYVIAHSIGGYIFVKCISKNKNLSNRLLLTNIPGLFSSNGSFDYLWACFFTFGIPHNIIRLLGTPNYSNYIINNIINILNLNINSIISDYWHLVQINNRMKSDKIVRKIIKHRGLYALGIDVALPYLLNVSIPVAIIYGENDVIAPPHQGHFIRNLSGIPIYIINDSGHIPYTSNNGLDFLEIIELISNLTSTPNDYINHFISNNINNNLNNISYINNKKLSECLFKEEAKWAWYPCLPVPPFISKLFFSYGIYPAIHDIRNDCLLR